MLRIRGHQIDALNERVRRDQCTRVLHRLEARYPQAFPEDRQSLQELLIGLFDSGFVTDDLQYRAAVAFLETGLRDDADAAEDRALCGAILFEDRHSPETRLAFLDSQIGQ